VALHRAECPAVLYIISDDKDAYKFCLASENKIGGVNVCKAKVDFLFVFLPLLGLFLRFGTSC